MLPWFFALNRHVSIMGIGDPLDDAQAQTTAAHFTATCFVCAIEAVEDQLLVFRCDADAGILNVDLHPFITLLSPTVMTPPSDVYLMALSTRLRRS